MLHVGKLENCYSAGCIFSTNHSRITSNICNLSIPFKAAHEPCPWCARLFGKAQSDLATWSHLSYDVCRVGRCMNKSRCVVLLYFSLSWLSEDIGTDFVILFPSLSLSLLFLFGQSSLNVQNRQWFIDSSPLLDRAVSYICLYCGLQVLGMLYGFLINCFATISLFIASIISGR